MGCVPALLILSENSRAPHKLKLSQIPRAFNLFSLQKSERSSILAAPSHIEYWVWILNL